MSVYIFLKKSKHKKLHREHLNDEYEEHTTGVNLHDKYIKENTGYSKYIEKYGYHFNDKLAEWAISKLKNVSGPHSWNLKQVESVVNNLYPSKNFKHTVTLGDLAYQSNMYYADLYPDGISVEQNCVKSAILIANDPDGYEGQIFCRWLTDYMMKDIHIDWDSFL